ncbi:uncharacterized protein [Palaemon carinicauda]|uniref:uncharacterized protein n=1 Tax=Palaemon carinicauda TaxID=392227 RepID=UPI0035B68591
MKYRSYGSASLLKECNPSLPEKVATVQNLPTLSPIKALQKFSGSINYYHCFLPAIDAALDCPLCLPSTKVFQKMIEDLNGGSRNVGLKRNLSKTMVIFNANVERQQLRVIDEPLRIVNINVYLEQSARVTLETWSLTNALEHNQVTPRRSLESIMMGITPRDSGRATWIREQTKAEDILANK